MRSQLVRFRGNPRLSPPSTTRPETGKINWRLRKRGMVRCVRFSTNCIMGRKRPVKSDGRISEKIPKRPQRHHINVVGNSTRGKQRALISSTRSCMSVRDNWSRGFLYREDAKREIAARLHTAHIRLRERMGHWAPRFRFFVRLIREITSEMSPAYPISCHRYSGSRQKWVDTKLKNSEISISVKSPNGRPAIEDIKARKNE